MIVRQLNGDIVDDFVEDSSGRLVPRKVSSSSSYSSSFRRLFHEAFLPQGFPDSVSDDYVPYQLWDTLQAFCSSITGALAMKAVLSGYGVGDETGSALAAAMTWLVKDGASMVGRIAFAWHLGAALDGDAKQWRLFADVLNDCAIFLELVSQFFPRNWFTPTICFAGVAKAVVGVAGGATRAALTQHQAKCNNMADVSAKDGSQETLTNLAALVVNLWLLPLVEERHALVWTLFLLFTILHIYSNYKAVSAVVMKTFNLTRFIHVATRYETEGCVPSPMAANEAEPVWLVQRNPTDSAFDIRFGVGVDQWRRSGHGAAFGALLRIFRGKNYIVCWSRKSPNIDVLLRRGCSVDDELEALFFAVVLRLHMDHRLSIVASSVSASAADELQLVRFRVDASFPRFRSALVAAEWIVDEAQFDSKAFRFSVEGEETAGSGDWGQGKRR